MTVEEIDLAYEGYLRKKEIEANLIKLAIATSTSEELIRLIEDKEYTVGNLQERSKCFEVLGIRENDYGV